MNSRPPQTPLNRGSINPAPDITPHVPDHELLRRIGVGSYGQVWLARNVTGAYRAVKVVYRQHFDHDRPYEREFSGIQKFEPVSRTHESQIDILHIGRNDKEGYFYYVMELADDANAEGGVRSAETNGVVDVTPWHVTPGDPLSEAQTEDRKTGKQENKTGVISSPPVSESSKNKAHLVPGEKSAQTAQHSSTPTLQDPSSYIPKTLRSEFGVGAGCRWRNACRSGCR